jgi:hypothetical protein
MPAIVAIVARAPEGISAAMGALLSDLRYSFQELRRRPVFAALDSTAIAYHQREARRWLARLRRHLHPGQSRPCLERLAAKIVSQRRNRKALTPAIFRNALSTTGP